MSPEQISALTALAAIVEKAGSWPIGSVILAVVFGPWVFAWLADRRNERRHQAVVRMYEDNVKLVKDYEKIADEQADTIRLSTAATTTLTTWLQTRPACYERIKDMKKGAE